jgi:hypothetical protein
MYRRQGTRVPLYIQGLWRLLDELNRGLGGRRKNSHNHGNAASSFTSGSAPPQAQFFREYYFKLRVRGTVLAPEIHKVKSKMEEMYTLATLYNTNCTKSFYRYVHNFSNLSFACVVPVH